MFATSREADFEQVKFDEGDPRDPNNFSYARKWAITLTCCIFAGITSAASSSYSISYESMMQDLDCTNLQVTLGLSLYVIGYGVIPLISSSFSEECGRRPVYIASSVFFLLAEVMNALAPNIKTVIVSRALQGVFASAGVSMLAGTIADIWQPHERGVPMAMFSFTAVFSIGLGSVFGGLIASNPHLGWRWVQWIHVMFAGIFSLCVIFVLSETRSSVVLTRIAKDVRKTTGDARYRSSSEIDKPSMLSMIKVTCTRPLYLLLTEPIVQSFSLWVGLTWGVLFCLLESVTTEFQSVYNFNVSETGLVFLTQRKALLLHTVGAILGLMANMYQETLYRKHFATKGQEARLYIACAAAIVMPVSMFIFAWTASPHIHWIFPLIGLTAFMSSVFVVYQVSFLYLADCYGTYASSALAGLSLARNMMALIFPLFSQQMFAGMTYKWGLTLWASLSAVMGPIPWILFFFGPKIRSHSKVSRKILETELQQLDGDQTVVSSPIEEKSMKV
ncbi:MFS general substrate transporter [Rhizopogon vinicolor AM-OR11-026]|uniref:MFS general substrate transporter n=1 Tax=Rhizopogon vinicolor AM-OR11-026 TaxID=1314800 RepID=A0A1B7N4E0_9AGAM|nr:MFS general substrate transporter [Rhizopogon vinicolor AM-OR11-026]